MVQAHVLRVEGGETLLEARQRVVKLQVHGGRDFRERGGEVKFLAVQAALPESRAAARSWPMSGSRAFSSGPWSSPVRARRSGRKSSLPLRPVAAFTAAVQLPQVASAPGSGGRSQNGRAMWWAQ